MGLATYGKLIKCASVFVPIRTVFDRAGHILILLAIYYQESIIDS